MTWVGAGASTLNVIFVSEDGLDTNDGRRPSTAKRTVKAAAAIAVNGDVIRVAGGIYQENNPISLPQNVSVDGDDLRNTKIIQTNTFGATSIAQSDYKLEHLVEKMNIESVKAVKQAINESNSDIDKSKIFIAGAMGPTNRTASISPDVEDPGKRNVTFDELVNKVKSPKGTTEAGLNSLIVDNFDNIIFNAIRQATNRSIEISTELKNE